MKLQYGCGLCAPESWENYDSSPVIALQRIPVFGRFFRTARFPAFPKKVKKGNISRGLNLTSGSADLIYCSHVLEHLALEELRAALRETYRILKFGGTFRFVLPDLEAAINEYLTQDTGDRACKFMESTLLGRRNRKRSLPGFVREWLGGSSHLWMWDYHGMEKELVEAGFSGVRRARFGDSALAEFQEVEDEERWRDCLGMECRKTRGHRAGGNA